MPKLEKQYKSKSGSNYTIKAKSLGTAKKLVRLDLYGFGSDFPLWSNVEPLANLEKLSDAMFRKYEKHIEQEILLNQNK